MTVSPLWLQGSILTFIEPGEWLIVIAPCVSIVLLWLDLGDAQTSRHGQETLHSAVEV